ncbi:MAG: DnaJ C-terminal domain-containing protein [Rhizonema sp. PD38]|nr:DnaJ C-terminal domain-containing protein [Rhizonema sp. PD38]
MRSQVTLTPEQAESGYRLNINTVDGSGELVIPPETKHGAVLRLKNRGVPNLGNPSERGHHLISVNIQ